MKKDVLIILLIAFLLLSVFSVSAICVNTADNYASEVVLNKPGIEVYPEKLNSAYNVVFKDNQYILKSDYSPDLAVILEKINEPVSGLSVRLQIPVTAEEKNLPFVKFSSTGATGTLNLSNEDNYDGWTISCTQGNPRTECEFIKGRTDILASLISSKYEVTIGTREELADCNSCDGKCLFLSGEAKCLNKQLKNDIEDILKHAGLVSSIDEIFVSYKLISSGNAVITDLSPAANEDINWQEAMKQELLGLKKNFIILITDKDIDSIASLSQAGKSGTNSRIVYSQDISGGEKWLYYYETKLPILTQLENCQEFPLSSIPTGLVSFTGTEISTYYLIPIIFTSFLVILLLVLIAAARIIDREKKKRKLKPITGLGAAS